MQVDRRGLAIALAVSVLGNLFLAGAVGGRLLTAHGPVAPPGAGGLVPAAHVRLLSPSERIRFAGRMAPHRPAIRAARQVQREARAKVEIDIAAVRYDPARTADDLAAFRDAQLRQQAQVHAALVDALGALSPASRAALARQTASRAERPQAADAGETNPARSVGNGAAPR
jgi:uncharacterized membrane protein